MRLSLLILRSLHRHSALTRRFHCIGNRKQVIHQKQQGSTLGSSRFELYEHSRRHANHPMRSSQPSAADTKAMSEINGDMAPLITLEPVEEELRTLLLAVAEHVKIEDGKDKASQLRLAGGWVRDKLLGVASHDVDVAIDDTTGEAFGQRMKAYLELPDKAEQHGLMLTSPDETAGGGSQVNKARTVRGLHKIKANPERSKQLETVTTKLLGLDVDLVNLRKEVYDDKTRTPRMEFADGPEEDAFRRDATVNALFYNLQTQQVEDFTGRGLEDMEEKILRTPLEPFQTFQDDPLRVLRLVRFASRLGYSIDDAAKQAMQDQAIKKALREKISRERVGVEVEKMLKGESAACYGASGRCSYRNSMNDSLNDTQDLIH